MGLKLGGRGGLIRGLINLTKFQSNKLFVMSKTCHRKSSFLFAVFCKRKKIQFFTSICLFRHTYTTYTSRIPYYRVTTSIRSPCLTTISGILPRLPHADTYCVPIFLLNLLPFEENVDNVKSLLTPRLYISVFFVKHRLNVRNSH